MALSPASPSGAPARGAFSRLRHRVGFYQTDGMAIMHHANYLHLLELSRIAWLDEHDEPYRDYVARGLHFAVTRADLRYRSAARFDDELLVEAELDWLRGASLGLTYTIHCQDRLIATALTEHALVDSSGRPTRIPAPKREHLAKLARRTGPDRDA